MALEIMSPAGSLESVFAAVRGGADAVYFGASSFNARRNAKNLDDSELLEAMRFCRLRGVKTYITVNTLLTDRELLEATRLIENLRDIGADALIVQDLGMARLVRTIAPDLPMHGSTQMTVHNLGGVLAAHSMGFSRVVLSREVPLKEIKYICAHSPIEIEIFVHGALCMCYSGQCYLSAAIGSRSGNRGLCAQPCRLEYNFEGMPQSNPLSLKDLCLAEHLQEIADAGVACIKIEGRMKRPEYTALVTKIYKDAVKSGINPSAENLEKLAALFSRDGFTDAFFTQNKGPHMFGVRREGDGFQVRELHKQARMIYESSPEPPTVPVNFRFEARRDAPMTLHCMDINGNQYEATALPAEQAINRATTADEVESCLLKTGGTVFYPASLHVELDLELRISASAINAMRRQCLDAISLMRRTPPKRESGEFHPGARRIAREGPQKYIFSFLSANQLSPEIISMKADFIYLPLDEIIKNLDFVCKLMGVGQKFAAILDRIIFDSDWQNTMDSLRVIKNIGISDLVCGNVGQLAPLTAAGYTVRGDTGLNIMNSQAMREARDLGAKSIAVSFEMNLAQIRDLSFFLPCEMLVYGRLPLMITEGCIIKNRTGRCSCDGKNPVLLQGATGRSFPVIPEKGCRTTLYNSEPLWLADKLSDLNKLGISHLRLCFTTEDAQECARVVKAYLNGGGTAPQPMTRGLYFRGVE